MKIEAESSGFKSTNEGLCQNEKKRVGLARIGEGNTERGRDGRGN